MFLRVLREEIEDFKVFFLRFMVILIIYVLNLLLLMRYFYVGLVFLLGGISLNWLVDFVV